MKEDLISLCRKGNRDAQEQLYRYYAAKVMGVCRRYAGVQEDAKDIFQEAFVNIFKSFEQQQKIDNPDAWIRRITVNTAINYYHKNKKHYCNLTVDDFPHFESHHYNDILSRLEREDLMNLLDILPVGCRHVFNMYVIEGYSHKEIAETMNISEGTSKSQLSRAKELMKLKLESLNYACYRKKIV